MQHAIHIKSLKYRYFKRSNAACYSHVIPVSLFLHLSIYFDKKYIKFNARIRITLYLDQYHLLYRQLAHT